MDLYSLSLIHLKNNTIGACCDSCVIVVGLLFGAGQAFFPVDVVGNVISVTKQLGSEGLVGLVAVWVLGTMFSRQLAE